MAVDGLACRGCKLFMIVGRDPAAIVNDTYGIIFKDGDVNPVAIACKGFIDAVIHHFVYKMMEPGLSGGADIHARPFPDSFYPAKDLYF